MAGPIERALQGRIASGSLEADEAQAALARRLDALLVSLAAAEEEQAGTGAALKRFFGVGRPEATPGLYIHGAVGRGKTMLMDLFFEAAPQRLKRRVHFHSFMADVHTRIHVWRQAKKAHAVAGDDPIAPVAAALAAEAHLLCFDEFAVNDIADAMILGRLFERLFEAGVTVVATSNVAPADLYEGGLNRALFLPFIALLEQHLAVVRLEARTDFRLEKLSRSQTWLVPADAAATAAIDAAFLALTGRPEGRSAELPLLGRTVTVPQAAAGVARFSFADLVESPLGASDFLAIARAFHTVMIDGIRVIQPGERNIAKRFITLIDTLYDRHVKLVASAGAEPTSLYRADEGREAFEFQRTASRLIEMRSDGYLALPHGAAASPGSGDTTGLVET